SKQKFRQISLYCIPHTPVLLSGQWPWLSLRTSQASRCRTRIVRLLLGSLRSSGLPTGSLRSASLGYSLAAWQFFWLIHAYTGARQAEWGLDILLLSRSLS